MRSPALDARRSAALIGGDGSTAQQIELSTNYLANHIDENLNTIDQNVSSVGRVATVGMIGVTFLVVRKLLKDMGIR